MLKLKLLSTLAFAALTLCACSSAGAQMYGVEGRVGVGGMPPAYGAPPPGYGAPNAYGAPAGRPQTRRFRVEHPLNVPDQYRCFADGRPSGGPASGTGWCAR